MSPWLWIALVLSALLITLYLSMTAGRLDRLHKRVDISLLSLHSHLLRRSATALELSTSGALDPASSVLVADAAHRAQRASQDQPTAAWVAAESDLTAALVATLDDVDEVAEVCTQELGSALLADLADRCQRVALSRRFHNDAVQATRRQRSRPVVRVFRLAGRTPLPQTWEMDDSVPLGLEDQGAPFRGPMN
jgi:uncharacterized protein YfaS (alpha-2-macroglobulin family)